MRRHSDRGATLTEYALGIALVAVVSIVAVNRLESASSEQLDERSESSGAELEASGQGFEYGGATTGGSTGSTGDPEPPPPTVVDGVGFKNPKSQRVTSTSWLAQVTVVIDADGKAVADARAEVTFTYGSTSTTLTCPFASNDKGEIECQLSGIPGSADSVTMTVDRVFGSSVTYSAPSDIPTQMFARPNGVGP